MKEKQNLDIIDVEYTEGEAKIDRITPVIESKTRLVDDKKGNRLLWIAIALGLFAFASLVLAFFS